MYTILYYTYYSILYYKHLNKEKRKQKKLLFVEELLLLDCEE